MPTAHDAHEFGVPLTEPITMRQSLRMAVRIATNLTLPPDLVSEIDMVAGKRNRSAFVEDAVRRALRREKLRQMIEHEVGSWSGVGPPGWTTSEGVVAWVRALRAEVTDAAPGP